MHSYIKIDRPIQRQCYCVRLVERRFNLRLKLSKWTINVAAGKM
jgi:hypothetical protein